MDPSKPTQSQPQPPQVAELVQRPRLPPPPPMRVVTKGWWTMREEQVSVEDLEKANHERD